MAVVPGCLLLSTFEILICKQYTIQHAEACRGKKGSGTRVCGSTEAAAMMPRIRLPELIWQPRFMCCLSTLRIAYHCTWRHRSTVVSVTLFLFQVATLQARWSGNTSLVKLQWHTHLYALYALAQPAPMLNAKVLCPSPNTSAQFSLEVTLLNSPLLSLYSQNFCPTSVNPCLTHPLSLTWYKLMKPPEKASL